jgi:hypothetical protein
LLVAGESSKRYFTIEEANAALEVLRPLLAEILEIRTKVLASQAEVWPVMEKAAGNGGSRSASLLEREFERLKLLVRQVNASGAILKDLNSGLVDFPSLREGREVYLCWQYGEDRVAYWHDVDGGFAGRQLI